MLRRPRWILVAAVFVIAACHDTLAPQLDRVGVSADRIFTSSDHVLRQAPNAPPLQTYQVSFWVRGDKDRNITVNYAPPAHGPAQRFIQVHVPGHSVHLGSDWHALAHRDSVEITMTIDTTKFLVDFEPSLRFSDGPAAQLTFCLENADPDVNGDGVVNATDVALLQQVVIVYQGRAAKHRLHTIHDALNQCVSAKLLHFSAYAVSW